MQDTSIQSGQEEPSGVLTVTIGKRIKDARKARGMSLENLAAKVRFSVAQLSKFENGKITPSIPSLIRLATEFQRPVGYFLQTDAEMPRCLATLVPPWDTEGQGIEHLARLVNDQTNGSLSIAVFSGAQLGTSAGHVESLMSGLIDIFAESLAFFEPYSEAARISSIPFCYSSEDHYQRFLESDLYEREVRQALRKHSVELLGANWNWKRGPTLAVVARKPILSPDDLRGVRVRSSENHMMQSYLRLLGTTPVVVPWTDVYEAFEGEQFDAMITNLSHIVSMRFTKVGRFVTLLNYRPPDLTFAMNLQRYQMLVPSFQIALEEAAKAARQFSNRLLEATADQIPVLLEEDDAVFCRVRTSCWQQEFREIIQRLEQKGHWRSGLFEEITSLSQI